MTAVATTPVIRTDAWESFTPGAWMQHIDVRDFILRNFTPYTGDASFLAGPTARTLTVWQTLQRDVVDDYRRAYNTDPPRIIGVSVAVDTADTGEPANTWFGDIAFIGKASR